MKRDFLENLQDVLNNGPKAESPIDYNQSLTDIFKELIKKALASFKEDGYLIPQAFLIFKNDEAKEYKIAMFPLISNELITMDMHNNILRGVIRKFKEMSTTSSAKLVGVVLGLDCFMGTYKKEEIVGANGKLKNLGRQSENPNAKEVLMFQLEEQYVKHIRAYEYITSDEGDTVVNPNPYLDEQREYDEEEAKASRFGFVYAEKRP